jgi:hypothetical protein
MVGVPLPILCHAYARLRRAYMLASCRMPARNGRERRHFGRHLAWRMPRRAEPMPNVRREETARDETRPVISRTSLTSSKTLWPILAIAFRSIDACQAAAFRSAPFNSTTCGFLVIAALHAPLPFAASLWRFSMFCLACAKRPCGRLNGEDGEGLSADPLQPGKERRRSRSLRRSVPSRRSYSRSE